VIYDIQGDSLARGPKQIWEKYSRIWRNAFKCAWMWKETSFSVDYEQVIFASFPVCVYKFSSHYLNNIIFIDNSLRPLATESPCVCIHIYIYIYICGPGISVGIATELRAGRSGIESRWGRVFPPVQTGPGAHPVSCKMGTGSFPEVKCGQGVLLTTHPLLVSRSWKSRAVTLPTIRATPGL
jgi:hypothetical protein